MPKASPAKKAVARKPTPAKKASRKPTVKPRAPLKPGDYTPAKALAIVERLSNGEPMAVICRDVGMPSVTTVWRWGQERPEFAKSIARAREEGFDVIAAECLQIANTPLEGVETTIDEKGVSEKRGDMLGHRKLQIETRLKLLAKWDPKRYGEKLDLTVDATVKGSVSYKANIPGRG